MKSGPVVGVACVHATKLYLAMTAIIVTRSVDLSSVREDVGKSTLNAEFAVSLVTTKRLADFRRAKDPSTSYL